jgi:hypothetical protein
MMDAFTKATHESSAATDHHNDVQDKNKFSSTRRARK